MAPEPQTWVSSLVVWYGFYSSCPVFLGLSSLPWSTSLQGVNVWALVAAIVLLSSSVNDIQQLLFCLRRPGSTVTMPDITETLYCIAVLLYAMREKGINISNRIHYNIFYCLYLQENSYTQATEVKEEPSIWPGYVRVCSGEGGVCVCVFSIFDSFSCLRRRGVLTTLLKYNFIT